MNTQRQTRIGIVCAALYVIVFLGAQAYVSSQDHVPDAHTKPVDEQIRIFLIYAAHHGTLLSVGALLAALGYLLLAGVAYGVVPVLRGAQPRMATIALAIGVTSAALACIGVVVETVGLTTLAGQYGSAHTDAARLTAIHSFKSQSTIYQGLDLLSSLGVALWLGLMGVILVRSRGTRSVAGWGTIAACLLVGIGFPALVLWTAGAGLGLWRISQAGYMASSLGADAPEDEPEEASTPVRRTRATGRRAGKDAGQSMSEEESAGRPIPTVKTVANRPYDRAEGSTARAVGAHGSKSRRKRRH